MPSRLEHFRRAIREAGSPLQGHSANQRMAKRTEEGEKRLENQTLGTRRQQHHYRRHQEFLNNLSQKQFDRALGNLREGHGSNEDAFYVSIQYALQGNIYAARVILRLVDTETLPVERYPSPSNWDMSRLDPVEELPLSAQNHPKKSA